VHPVYRQRLASAAETEAEWYPDLYDVGWSNAPHRALSNLTSERWEAAGRPRAGNRPGEGEPIAADASGNPVVRYASALPLEDTTGDIEALSLWAGQSVALAQRVQPAAEIVASLVSRI
jgi:NAD(P)H-dependent flavin oxidoreductase YrpB (nitropropane dioxygenase family)